MGNEPDCDNSESIINMPITVLTIEDDPLYRSLIKGYLEASGGFEVLEADTLALGLECIEHHRPDAILVDLGLPDANGLDVFQAVIAIAPHTPVIMLTGLDEHITVVQAMSKGAADYLVKGEPRARKIGSITRRAVDTALVRRQQSAIADAARREQAALNLLSIVSHELRTPLHGILAFAGLGLQRLEKGNVDVEALKDYFNEIMSAGKHLLTHATDLTDMHKIEHGVMSANKRKTNIVDMVRSILISMRYLFEERGQILTVVDGDKDIAALADPFLLGRAIRNILNNAANFSAEQSQVEVEILRQNGFAEIAVRDSGIGIPEDEIGNIFEKFKQGSNAPPNSGMGLGLAVSQEIILMHHGTITAKRRDEGGTEFKVFLPLYAESVEVSDV